MPEAPSKVVVAPQGSVDVARPETQPVAVQPTIDLDKLSVAEYEKKMKADARKVKEAKLADEIKDLRRIKQDMEDDLKKKDNELTSAILKDVLEITKKVGAEHGFSLVLQAGPQVVYADSSLDITDEVLKKYDAGK